MGKEASNVFNESNFIISGKLSMRQKESGAAKVHALVAPLLGNGSDGKGISAL